MPTPTEAGTTMKMQKTEASRSAQDLHVNLPSYDKVAMEDVSFLTAMALTVLGNYAQTGHFGGPLSYTPYNVALHLGGSELGGMTYDIRNPKHPYGDKFMLAGGHCIPTCYALWMILYQAMINQHEATGDNRFAFDFEKAILPIDALAFRRSQGAADVLLKENGLTDHPLFAQAKIRGLRFLAGHAETTDVTNDVNGGPSGVGLSTSAGKALFWDVIGAPQSLKVFCLEGEFALTEGHAQELKTAALAQKVGKRLRVLMSLNNAGIDDSLIGGVIDKKYEKDYDFTTQWASYGWNVFNVDDGSDFDQLFAAFKTMEDWDGADRRPMIMIGNTVKGWWPGAADGQIPGYGEQIVNYKSHPYAFKMNSEYFQALAGTFEQKYGVEFVGIRDGVPQTEKDRLIEFKTNLDVVMSVLEKKPGLQEWLANRLVSIADEVNPNLPVNISVNSNPFQDERLQVANLPEEPFEATVTNPTTKESVTKTITLFHKPGVKSGTRKAISEIGKWLNYVTGNRMFTAAADLSGSINLENMNFLGHYDPETNPHGTRLKAAITEAVNSATICGLVGQNASPDPDNFAGVWGISGTYGAFTPLMYLPARIHSQQNQDSPFELGVLNILAGHSGPETAADARSHFGIFSPQVWTLFPRGQVCNLYFWDYNDVAPGYFAAVQEAVKTKNLGVIVIHVARPDFHVADRSLWADTDLHSAAKGCYMIRDWDPKQPKQGTVLVQGSSATNNLVGLMDRLNADKLNVRIVAVISEDLFNLQSREYQEKILPLDQRYDCMVVTTMTKRLLPISNLGPLTEEYTLSSDFDDCWRTGGLEPDVITEAKLDPASIYNGVKRFVDERQSRLSRQKSAFGSLEQ